MRVDIHNHTRYSNIRLLDALATPEELIDRGIELGLKAIAITDHEALCGHIKANKYAKEVKDKIKVILGNEIYLVDERPTNKHYHYILLAKDAIGHHQLRVLSSIAWLNGYTANGLFRVDTLKSDLERIVKENPGHLIASTACLGGELSSRILSLTKAEKLEDEETAAEEHNKIVEFLLWNKDLFGDDFYLEVQPGTSTEQLIANRRMISISSCFGIKMIPTSDTHYLKKEDRPIHKAYLTSKQGEREVDAFYEATYLHSDEEMIQKLSFSGYDELFVKQMFETTLEIADKIEDYSLEHSQQIPHIDVPFTEKNDIPQLKDYPVANEMTHSESNIERYWINTCFNKLKELNKVNDIYLSRLNEEARVKRAIGEKLNTNMFEYPILLAHYIKTFWDLGSTIGAGRGSACAALNHYLLGITQLDPIEWNFPFFRYMNDATVELGDIDIDLAPSKIQDILNYIKEERGKDINNHYPQEIIDNLGAVYVCTFGTESSKSAIQTACRGYRSEEYPMGIDVDIAQYLSSLVPSERGFVRSLKDVVYGNEEKGWRPVTPFIEELKNYPGLLDIMLGIEGCISRRGRHASGVLLLDEDPFEFNAFMRTPSGEITTQYDLHDAEAAGSVKLDFLVTEVQDKIIECIKLLQEEGVIENDLSLLAAYNKYLHPDVLPIHNDNIWNEIHKGEILDIFQFDSPIGRQGIKKVRPNSMIELSSTNGLIRLMTTEQGAETWLDKYVRFKNNPNDLIDEYHNYNLSDAEIEVFNKYVKETYGIGISQEQLMRTLMDKDICDFSLAEANAARRVVSKKKMNKIPELREQIFSKAKNPNVAQYLWDYIVAPGLGYSFSDIHSMSYSFVGFQTAYLATHWNPIFWNTACLIVNSGSLESEGEQKKKTTDYKKIAKALGKIIGSGIKVSLVDINKSSYGFKPDTEENRILFGLAGVNAVGGEVVDQIIENRPYVGLLDFMRKCPQNKTVMISLIKAGAFDETEKWAKTLCKEPRAAILLYYLTLVSPTKKKITLQNFAGLVQNNLIPESLNLQKRIFQFNKYLKDNKKGDYYVLGENAVKFYEAIGCDIDNLIYNGEIMISQKVWDKYYKNFMDAAREWIKDNQEAILTELNDKIIKENWEKYAAGTISSWEMNSLCFYYHKHELADVDLNKYGISDFFALNEIPEIESTFKRKEQNIPIYKLTRIAGTVIAKDDVRSTVSILTLSGVVDVQFTKEHYAMYNRQLSETSDDGKKKVAEKGWFTRGTIIVVTGFRRGDNFKVKTYKSTQSESIYKVEMIDKGDMRLEHNRYGYADDDR